MALSKYLFLLKCTVQYSKINLKWVEIGVCPFFAIWNLALQNQSIRSYHEIWDFDHLKSTNNNNISAFHYDFSRPNSLTNMVINISLSQRYIGARIVLSNINLILWYFIVQMRFLMIWQEKSQTNNRNTSKFIPNNRSND